MNRPAQQPSHVQVYLVHGPRRFPAVHAMAQARPSCTITYKISRAVKVDQELGSVPVRALKSKARFLSLVIVLMDAGSVPVKPVSNRSLHPSRQERAQQTRSLHGGQRAGIATAAAQATQVLLLDPSRTCL